MKQIICLFFVLIPFNAFSQLNETFDGPEIQSNNLWLGDIESFFINSSGQLQHISPKGENEPAYLYIPLNYSETMTWEFEVNVDFKTTNSNYIRIYVYMNPEEEGMSYYLQIGNNSRQVSFYSVKDNKSTVRIAGRKELLEEPFSTISIRLTLEENYEWTLYTRKNPETEYYEEGFYRKQLEDIFSEGHLSFSFKNVKERESSYRVDNIFIYHHLPGDSEKPGEPQEPKEPEIKDIYPGMILINEIMADPKGVTLLPETEYVELFNNTEKNISLKDWEFCYGEKVTILEPFTLPSQAYVVLYRMGRPIWVDEPGIEMPLEQFPAQLANGGKQLQLKAPNGDIIDEVFYDKAKPGKSWERIGTKWLLSIDERGGTPGSQNSLSVENDLNAEQPQPFDIIFNEILPEPYEGGSEYIEIYNRSNQTISLKDLSIATRRSNGLLSKGYALSSYTQSLLSAEYVLLTKDPEGIYPFYQLFYPERIHQMDLPVLANTSSTLVLYNTKDSTIIDELSYHQRWHSSFIQNAKGVALERISPDVETQNQDNWTSASYTAGYGTPGYENSQYLTGDNGSSTAIQPPVYYEDGTYTIDYTLDVSGYSCRIFVYNLAGRRIAQIINHELMDMKGSLRWDGLGMDNRKVLTGLYILYVELYHPNGKTKQYKTPFLIR